MKEYVIIPLLILCLYPNICFSQDKVELEIINLLKSDEVVNRYKSIDLMKELETPSDKIIYAVFNAFTSPPFFSHFISNSNHLLVKWGNYTTPYIREALRDSLNLMHQRTPKLLLDIARKHEAELIIPAVSELLNYIKHNVKNSNRGHALWAIAELGPLANEAIPFLTNEMIDSKESDIFWSFSIARALEKIAGNGYLPIQTFLAEEKKYRIRDTTYVNEKKFKLNVGYDISDIEFREEKMKHLSLVSPSQHYPNRIIKYKNIVYNIAFNNDNKIKYISTIDSNFFNKDSLIIGDTVKHIKSLGYTNFKKVSGWGYTVELQSGWYAAFCNGKFCTDSELTENSKIGWFFKN